MEISGSRHIVNPFMSSERQGYASYNTYMGWAIGSKGYCLISYPEADERE